VRIRAIFCSLHGGFVIGYDDEIHMVVFENARVDKMLHSIVVKMEDVQDEQFVCAMTHRFRYVHVISYIVTFSFEKRVESM
jgi:hypothetical protein